MNVKYNFEKLKTMDVFLPYFLKMLFNVCLK